MINPVKWSIDQAHSHISFQVNHFILAHITGKVSSFDASIYMSGTDFNTAEISFWLEVDSITTGNPHRDADLKSLDFLDARNYKQIAFTSKSIEAQGEEGMFTVWGALTIIGVTKNIVLEVDLNGILKNPVGDARIALSVAGKINRTDWGLLWNTHPATSSYWVGEEIRVFCEVELTHVNLQDLIMELDSDQVLPKDFIPYNPIYNHESITK